MMIRLSTREVEDNDGEYACRGMENIACTRCTEAIITRYNEEIGSLLLLEVVVSVVGKGNSGVKKEEGATAEYH
jgi:hypothetical protein